LVIFFSGSYRSASAPVPEAPTETPAEATTAAEASKDDVVSSISWCCGLVLIISQKEEKKVKKRDARQSAVKVGRRLSSRVVEFLKTNKADHAVPPKVDENPPKIDKPEPVAPLEHPAVSSAEPTSETKPEAPPVAPVVAAAAWGWMRGYLSLNDYHDWVAGCAYVFSSSNHLYAFWISTSVLFFWFTAILRSLLSDLVVSTHDSHELMTLSKLDLSQFIRVITNRSLKFDTLFVLPSGVVVGVRLSEVARDWK
jgi:hypothetical protein